LDDEFRSTGEQMPILVLHHPTDVLVRHERVWHGVDHCEVHQVVQAAHIEPIRIGRSHIGAVRKEGQLHLIIGIQGVDVVLEGPKVFIGHGVMCDHPRAVTEPSQGRPFQIDGWGLGLKRMADQTNENEYG